MPCTTLVEDVIWPLLLMFPLLSHVFETVPSEREFSVALPTIPTALLLLESTVTPHCVALIWPPLFMVRPCPVPASRQIQVGLLNPPPATARAETFKLLALWLNAERKKVGIGLETSASMKFADP